MINFREIFNINYSYFGLIIIGVLMVLLVLLAKKKSVKVMGYSFLISGIVLLVIYLFGNIIVDSFNYRFFIEVISDNFFSNVIIFAVVSMVFGGLSLVVYRYIE